MNELSSYHIAGDLPTLQEAPDLTNFRPTWIKTLPLLTPAPVLRRTFIKRCSTKLSDSSISKKCAKVAKRSKISRKDAWMTEFLRKQEIEMQKIFLNNTKKSSEPFTENIESWPTQKGVNNHNFHQISNIAFAHTFEGNHVFRCLVCLFTTSEKNDFENHVLMEQHYDDFILSHSFCVSCQKNIKSKSLLEEFQHLTKDHLQFEKDLEKLINILEGSANKESENEEICSMIISNEDQMKEDEIVDDIERKLKQLFEGFEETKKVNILKIEILPRLTKLESFENLKKFEVETLEENSKLGLVELSKQNLEADTKEFIDDNVEVVFKEKFSDYADKKFKTDFQGKFKKKFEEKFKENLNENLNENSNENSSENSRNQFHESSNKICEECFEINIDENSKEEFQENSEETFECESKAIYSEEIDNFPSESQSTDKIASLKNKYGMKIVEEFVNILEKDIIGNHSSKSEANFTLGENLKAQKHQMSDIANLTANQKSFKKSHNLKVLIRSFSSNVLSPHKNPIKRITSFDSTFHQNNKSDVETQRLRKERSKFIDQLLREEKLKTNEAENAMVNFQASISKDSPPYSSPQQVVVTTPLSPIRFSMETDPMEISGNSTLMPWLNKNVLRRNFKYSRVYNRMLSEDSLKALFKCMDSRCHFTTQEAELFLNHLCHAHERKSSQTSAENFHRLCSYCTLREKDLKSLVHHINDVHIFDVYQCSHCFYRSRERQTCVEHFKLHHKNELKKILDCHKKTMTEIQKDKIFVRLRKKRDEFVEPILCKCKFENYFY